MLSFFVSVNAQHKCRRYCSTLPIFKYCRDNLAIIFKARMTDSDFDPEGQTRAKASDRVTVEKCRSI